MSATNIFDVLNTFVLIAGAALVAGIIQWAMSYRSEDKQIKKEKRSEAADLLKEICAKLNEGAISVQRSVTCYKNTEPNEGQNQEHYANKHFGDARMLAIILGNNILASKIHDIQNLAIAAIRTIKRNPEAKNECNAALSQMNTPQTEAYDMLREAYGVFIP